LVTANQPIYSKLKEPQRTGEKGRIISNLMEKERGDRVQLRFTWSSWGGRKESSKVDTPSTKKPQKGDITMAILTKPRVYTTNIARNQTDKTAIGGKRGPDLKFRTGTIRHIVSNCTHWAEKESPTRTITGLKKNRKMRGDTRKHRLGTTESEIPSVNLSETALRRGEGPSRGKSKGEQTNLGQGEPPKAQNAHARKLG